MALKSCQVCGSEIQVRSTDTEVSCQTCGSVYDVIVHPKRIISPELGVTTAQKYPTQQLMYLQFPDTVTQVPETYVFFVGESVKIRAILERNVARPGEPADWRGVRGRDMGANLSVKHRVNTRPWETIFAGKPPADGFYFDNTYRLAVSGTHSFQVTYPGDDVLAACPSSTHSLTVHSRRIISPEVGTVTALPALTVRVLNAITKKPIDGARVLVDTYEAFTDAEGNAIYEVIPLGTYSIWAEARDYKPVTFKPKITLTEAGAVVDVPLWPLWSVGLAVVGGASILTLGATKAARLW